MINNKDSNIIFETGELTEIDVTSSEYKHIILEEKVLLNNKILNTSSMYLKQSDYSNLSYFTTVAMQLPTIRNTSYTESPYSVTTAYSVSGAVLPNLLYAYVNNVLFELDKITIVDNTFTIEIQSNKESNNVILVYADDTEVPLPKYWKYDTDTYTSELLRELPSIDLYALSIKEEIEETDTKDYLANTQIQSAVSKKYIITFTEYESSLIYDTIISFYGKFKITRCLEDVVECYMDCVLVEQPQYEEGAVQNTYSYTFESDRRIVI